MQYTAIDFRAPDADLFDFTSPPDAVVEEEVLELPDLAELPDPATFAEEMRRHDDVDVDVVGEGWATVLVAPLGEGVPDEAVVEELTERVPGGRLLSTSLVSVLLTDDGRLLAGAVTPERLLEVAGR